MKLYHGTTKQNYLSILKTGFKNHSFFSTNKKRAYYFGMKKGFDNKSEILLSIDIHGNAINNRCVCQCVYEGKDTNEYDASDFQLDTIEDKNNYFQPTVEKLTQYEQSEAEAIYFHNQDSEVEIEK